MKSGINVVSFFDGMGCLYVALKELAIPIESYHAYEIDKHAMKAAKALNPNVIHKGDVRFFDIKDYPDGVQIFAGGSPCTDLSFAGKMSGLICNSLPEYMELRNEYLETKDENLFFHNGKFQQSILFWEWLRALKEIQKVNPGVYFLLENVIMPKQHENTISKELGIASIRINANLVSAQNRDRNFWTNISLEPFGLFGDLRCTIPQPKDRGILLKHILESDVKEKYYLSDKMLKCFSNRKSEWAGTFKPTIGDKKANCVTARCYKMGVDDNYIKEFPVCLSQGRGEEAKQLRKQGIDKFADKELMPRNDGKTNTLSTVQKDNLLCVAMRGRNNSNGTIQQEIEPRNDGKTNCLTSVHKDNLVMEDWKSCDYRVDEGLRISSDDKSKTLLARSREDSSCGQFVIQLNPSLQSGGKQPYQQNRVYDSNCIAPALCANKADLLIMLPEATKKGFTEIKPGECFDFENPNSKTRRGRKMEDKSNCLMAQQNKFMQFTEDFRIRRLTTREAGRLQSIPEIDLDIMLNCGVSDSQLYKIYGNGWNCEVVKHILSYIKL